MRRIVYPLIWLGVTVAAVLIASAAVSSVRDQVTDTPTAMLPTTTTTSVNLDRQPSDPIDPASVPPISADMPSTSSTTTTAPSDPNPTTTSSTTTTTTTAPSDPIPTTTSSTTTTVAPATEIRSYELVGGLVSVEIGNETVRLAGASPKPGFTMSVENPGPEKVEVEFHNDDHESRFSGKFEDGEFEPSIDEHEEEDDD